MFLFFFFPFSLGFLGETRRVLFRRRGLRQEFGCVSYLARVTIRLLEHRSARPTVVERL